MENDLIESSWLLLKKGIQEIQEKQNSGLHFEELYRYAYRMVLFKHGEKLYNGVKKSIRIHLINKVRKDLLKVLNNNFLQDLNVAWNDHQISMEMISKILEYLHTVYIQPKKLENVHNLGLNFFRDLVVRYDNIRIHLRMTLLNLINLERKGEVVDQISIKNACQMLIILGMNSSLFYEEVFERSFLKQSVEFYKINSQKLLKVNDPCLYIRNVESIIMEESNRTKCYLHESTESRIVKVVEEELIKKHLKSIVEMENSGILHMLKNNKTDDLGRVYKLLTRVDEGSKIMSVSVGQYLREIGESLVHEKEIDTNAINYIEKCIDLKDKFNYFLIHAFFDDKIFKSMIESIFEYIFNINPKSAEYLSLFIDAKLKQGKRKLTEDEVKLAVDEAILIFSFLREKDLFESYYKKHIAKRLLLNKSASDDDERHVISKLKNESGLQFITKLEGMFKDMSISDTITEEFKEYTYKYHLKTVDLTVRVLTTGVWPTQALSKCNLPSLPNSAFEEFRKFYLDKHTGRQLRLQPQLGTADLNVTFYDVPQSDAETLISKFANSIVKKQSTKRKYIIQVSTYQMCVLLLFNTQEKLTFEDIQNETGIPEKDLIRALQSLTLGKPTQRILLKSPMCKEMELNHEFSVNESFTSKLHRIKIQTNKENCETDSERKETKMKINEKRKQLIEAAIMRIMKSRRKMTHNDLLVEIIKQLKIQFIPSSVEVKKRVEELIERDYISRSLDNRNTYFYSA